MLSLRCWIFGFLLFSKLALRQAQRTQLKSKNGTTSKIGHYGGRVGPEPGHQEELVESINDMEKEARYDHRASIKEQQVPLRRGKQAWAIRNPWGRFKQASWHR